MNTNHKKTFVDTLALQHRAQMYPEERNATECVLGEGAIKFKLSQGGMRNLFAALDQQANNVKGR